MNILFSCTPGRSLRKSSSDLSCKSFTEIVGSGTVKKPFASSGGVKKILDRRLKAADGHNKTNSNNKASSFILTKEASYDRFLTPPIVLTVVVLFTVSSHNTVNAQFLLIYILRESVTHAP